MCSFSSALSQHLHRCLPDGFDRGMMWCKFHAFRTSKDHFILWDKFLKESTKKGGPIFFQFITCHMFKQLIKQHYPAPAVVNHDTQNLSHQEENALRYAAGYIPRNLLSKIDHSSHKNKQILKMYLLDLVEGDAIGDDESQDWTKLVNRGGLNNITQAMFDFMKMLWN